MTPPDVLRDQIRARVAETPATGMKPRARTAVAVVVLLASAAIGLVVMRPDVRALPLASLLGVTLAVGLLASSTLLVALSPGKYGVGASITTLVTVTALTAPLYAAITLLSGLGATPDGPAVRGCFTMSLAIGAFALVGLTFALRRSVPVAPIARSALLGACAGAWAGLAVHLHCPCGETEHILVGHTLPIAISTVIAMIVSPRFLRP